MSIPTNDDEHSHPHTVERWRPGFHVIPKSGRLDNPCALGYHAASGLYIVGFRWCPKGWNWENISWGVAQSADLIDWDVSKEPSLQPSAVEDTCGISTGCMVDMNVDGISGGTITCFYTSAQILPIHYILPYQGGSELLHMATSEDGGKTWQRSSSNPVLFGPPSNVSVTGWRDPYVFHWDSMDQLLRRCPKRNLYAIIAGGIRDRSPTIFLYSVDIKDLSRWTYMTTLILPGRNFTLTPLWGDFGLNWEVTSILTLKNEAGQSFEIVIAGVEGCRMFSQGDQDSRMFGRRLQSRPLRTGRAQKWFSGRLHLAHDGRPKLQMRFSGHLDYGTFYAANSLFDPLLGERVVYGWILEDDLPDELKQMQGWSGFLSLPRTLKMTSVQNITQSCVALLTQRPGFGYERCQSGLFTVTTLWQGPDHRVRKLREVEVTFECLPVIVYSAADRVLLRVLRPPQPAAHMEVWASFSLGPCTTAAGLRLYHNPDLSLYTIIHFDAESHEVIIDRANSCNALRGIKTEPEIAPHVLLETFDCSTQTVTQEPLVFHIYFDVSSLEVFINNRVAISTRIYPQSGLCFGVQPFVILSKTGYSTQLDDLKLWTLRKSGLQKSS
ncbi:Arabinanase/levansucrase/invertase [Aureobasidium pullulans]|uniref:Arabinanase/levansucrase/invertase n=1 Tax=Aureobasidium pullulans TaxID=5580 RepID=A0A4S9JJQ7_AURPU|nr:Arabinanase/levansucrase/invertase [Aureobasidium pullulans]